MPAKNFQKHNHVVNEVHVELKEPGGWAGPSTSISDYRPHAKTHRLISSSDNGSISISTASRIGQRYAWGNTVSIGTGLVGIRPNTDVADLDNTWDDTWQHGEGLSGPASVNVYAPEANVTNYSEDVSVVSIDTGGVFVNTSAAVTFNSDGSQFQAASGAWMGVGNSNAVVHSENQPDRAVYSAGANAYVFAGNANESESFTDSQGNQFTGQSIGGDIIVQAGYGFTRSGNINIVAAYDNEYSEGSVIRLIGRRVVLPGLPTSDPNMLNALWVDPSTRVLKVSAG